MVYQDPLTEQRPEGEAVLMEKVGENEHTEDWRVSFVGDKSPEWWTRTIKKR